MKTFAVLFLCLILFISLAGWLGYSAQQYAPQESQDKTEAKYQAGPMQTIKTGFAIIWKFIHEYREEIIALGTLAIALFTIVLALATRELVEDAAQNAEKQLRAYVAIQGGSVVQANVDGGPGYRVLVEFKNSGQTPGYKFTTWMRPAEIRPIDTVPFGLPLPKEERNGSSIIGPGAGANQIRFGVWSPAEIDEIRKGTKAIFIWGGADYTDIFGHDRHFIYRIAISGLEDSGGGWALKPHKLGYDAN